MTVRFMVVQKEICTMEGNNENKCVLILGASLLQSKAIAAALQMGLGVFVTDGNDAALDILVHKYGAFRDCKINKLLMPPDSVVPNEINFFNIDLKDKEKLLNLATAIKSKCNLAGVFTAGTDFSASVSYITERLGLPGHSFDAAICATNKSKMRASFAQNRVSSPKYFICNAVEEVISKADVLGFPCVIKPVDSMGARGCRKICAPEEIEVAFLIAQSASRSGDVIIEEYMNGSEYSIDAIIYNGTLTITGLAIRHIKYPPYFIEMGHTIPWGTLDTSSHSQYNDVIATFANGCAALGLSCGAAKGDVKLTTNGACIGEIAARLSGGYMSGWTYPYASDLDLTKAALQIAIGSEPQDLLEARVPLPLQGLPYEIYDVPCKRVCSEKAFISIPGVAVDVHFFSKDSILHSSQYGELGWDIEHDKDSLTIRTSRNIVGDLQVDNKAIQKMIAWKEEHGTKNVFLRTTLMELPGKVAFPRNNVEKCGNVICVASDKEHAEQQADNARSNIFIELAPNNKKTDNFLFNCTEAFPPSAFPAPFTKICDMELDGVIAQNARVQDVIPPQVQEIIDKAAELVDWNGRTIMQSVNMFDIFCKIHGELRQQDFWYALFRGGLQGAVYACY